MKTSTRRSRPARLMIDGGAAQCAVVDPRSRAHLRPRLLQVEPHVHLAIHGRGHSDMLLRLLGSTGAPVELAETEVAVGDQRTHAELAGQRRGLMVETLRRLRLKERRTRL